jgi:HSP20 family protein
MVDIIEELAKTLANSTQSGQSPFSLDKDEIKKVMNQVQSQIQNSPWIDLITAIPKQNTKEKDYSNINPDKCAFSTYLFSPSGGDTHPQCKMPVSGSFWKNSNCPVDIREMESYIAVYYDLPGVNKADITLTLSNDNTLSMKVEKNPYSASSDTFLQRERYTGTIVKTVQLPKNINTETVSAKYEDGVLCVKINKTTPSQVKQFTIS